MTIEAFLQSVSEANEPPADLSVELTVLWFVEAGKWHSAHDLAQDLSHKNGSWLHAHLHREEGDLGNAAYWYHCANQPVPPPSLSIAEERKALISHFLASQAPQS